MSVLGRREPGSSGTGRPLSLSPPHHSTLYALFCGSGGNPRRGAAPVTHGLRAATTLQPVSRRYHYLPISSRIIHSYSTGPVPLPPTHARAHSTSPALAQFFTTCHFNIFRERRRRRRGRFALFLSRGRRPSPYADVNTFTSDRWWSRTRTT